MWETVSSEHEPEVGTADVALLVAARADVAGLPDDELLGRVVQLERAAVWLDAARAHALAELDTRGLTDTALGLRTGAWVANEIHAPHAATKRRVHVARRLRDEFPELDAALVAGKVTWFHCDTFCHAANPRIAHLLALLIPELVDLAGECGYGPWHRELWRVARRLDTDTGYDPDRDETASRLHLSRTLGGTRELTARLVGTLGASFEELLAAETDRQWRLHKHLADATNGETEIPCRAELAAIALVELCRKGAASDPMATHGPVADLTIAHHTRGPILPGLEPDDLIAAITGCGNEYTTIYGDLFTTRDLGCRLCDPTIRLLDIADHGERLDLGREQRFATKAQRRAARHRDGGCVFPGCDVPHRWTDLHHVWEWDHGGPTDMHNLASLCRFHHGVVHRNGWNMTADGDGTFTIHTPSGRRLHSQQHFLPTRAGP